MLISRQIINNLNQYLINDDLIIVNIVSVLFLLILTLVVWSSKEHGYGKFCHVVSGKNVAHGRDLWY